MSEFTVKTGNVIAVADEQKEIGLRMQAISDEIWNIRNNLSFEVKAKANINGTLKTAADRINAQHNSMSGMENGLRSIVSEYVKTEQKVVINAKSGNSLGSAEISGGSGNYSNHTGGTENRKNGILNFPFLSGLTPEEIMNLPETIRNKINGKIEEAKDYIIDQTSFEKEISTNGSLYNKEYKGKYGSAGITAGAYEAYASVEGGLITKDEDGNLLFNPNIDAKAGFSVCALSAVATAAIGDEMFGAGASGSVNAGKVSAEAEVKAGLYDKDGNLNPNASLNASAEAVAVEAKGEAKVSVLGTEAKVSGSAYVGVGAHANVGYNDGVLKFDVGAALGVGLSVGFELDVGGTVDAIKGACESALKNLFHW